MRHHQSKIGTPTLWSRMVRRKVGKDYSVFLPKLSGSGVKNVVYQVFFSLQERVLEETFYLL